MDDQLVTPDPNAAPVVEQTAEPEAPLSIAEHAAQYDPNRDKTKDPAQEEPLAPLAVNATEAEKTAHHSEQQRRERESGKFAPGKRRAPKDRARAEDVPRIQELTRQIKELQGQLAQPRQPQPAHVVTQPQVPQQAVPTPAQAPQRRWLGDPTNDPEPQESAYGGDPMKYLDARYEWLARGVNRYDRHEQQQQHQQLQRSISWGERVEKAITAHQAKGEDYAAIAFQPVPWASGSPIDQFIDGDDNGAEILYYLQSNPTERDAVLRLPALQQLKTLSLLSQRFDTASPQAAVTGGTGSVPRSNVRHLVPRPPNPVRTEPHGATTGPPTDGSLSIADHRKQFGRNGRRA